MNMRIFWRTLLLIALCVQMPLGALASFADGMSHAQHLEHSQSGDIASHDSHIDNAADHEESSAVADCSGAHHHCSTSHLSLMAQSHPSASTLLIREAFALRTEAFFASVLLPSIERPKWASI
jgi:hypothetical protein